MSAYGGPKDYEMVYINRGKVTYTWCSGTQAVIIESERAYNDGKWHKLNTNRALQRGMLYIDSKVVDQGMSENSTHVNNVTQIFFGSLPHRSQAESKLPDNVLQFKGSMYDLKLYDLELGSPDIENAAHDIYTREEIEIGSPGGYAKAKIKPDITDERITTLT